MDVAARSFTGPMVVLTWLVAVGWFILGISCFAGLAPPGGIVLGVLGVLGGLGTAWLALTLRVPYDDEGLVLPRRGRVRWSEVHAVEVQPGLLSIPLVVLRQGRALTEVPLDGLAWFGGPHGLAHSLAERIALAAGLPDVGVRHTEGVPGRRVA